VACAAVVVLGVLGLAACTGGGSRSVQSFCSAVRKNSDALNRPAVGVGVDNESLIETHVAAVQTIQKKAPTEIRPQVNYIADKTKAFADQWRTAGWKTGGMPEFDTGLDTRYQALDSFVSNRCQVTLTN
jgi:hypothetical protein